MNGLICCTLHCNLACSYCYEGNGKVFTYPDIQKINLEFKKHKDTIINYLDQLYEYNGNRKTRVIWHGGEPTLIDCSILDEIMDDQKSKNHNIKWALQTNGTLITDRYADVLKKHNVSVGISIDGLKESHDRFRVFKNGKPTFDVIMKNVDHLRLKGIICGGLVTITDNNINQLINIYKMFADRNMNFNFNALFPNDNGTSVHLATEEYAKKICELFDYWINDEDHTITISPFMQIIEGFVGKQHRVPACHWSKDCSKSFTAVDIHGNLYPCEHWAGNQNFCFGNIKNGLKHELEKNNYFCDRHYKLMEDECAECEIWDFCYGGCPWNAYEVMGSIAHKDATICVGRKAIIKHIHDVLQYRNKIV